MYALCLLGFGWSEKALVDYSNGRVWVDQISSFITEVVGGQPVVLAGNRYAAGCRRLSERCRRITGSGCRRIACPSLPPRYHAMLQVLLGPAVLH